MKQVLLNSMLTTIALCIFVISSVDIAEHKFSCDETLEVKEKNVVNIPEDSDIVSPLFIFKY